ncbi:hypothetical protein M758_6G200600 [Ceratodon purpureus]|nr:hypothetical protein M758_6G200600 [Ceratodon purpureus]
MWSAVSVTECSFVDGIRRGLLQQNDSGDGFFFSFVLLCFVLKTSNELVVQITRWSKGWSMWECETMRSMGEMAYAIAVKCGVRGEASLQVRSLPS